MAKKSSRSPRNNLMEEGGREKAKQKYYLLKTVINSDHRKRPFDPLLSIADIVMHQLLLLITSIIKERY